MMKVFEKKSRREIMEFSIIALISLAISGLILYYCPSVFAAGSGVTQAVGYVKKAVAIIATVSGAITTLYGIFSAISAHANENGPEQQKAISKIGAGIALLAFGFVVTNIPIENWIVTTM